MVVNITRTSGVKVWSFQRIPGGFWAVLNFIPGKLGLHLSISNNQYAAGY